jgi:gamma-glutamylcyclotransferase (GGCT)/AIG2-like uncharacterized protein YtfP
MRHKLFVYGSLKQGFGNHGLLKNSKYLGTYDTSDAIYQMVSLGGFPGVIQLDGQDEHCYILGELYEIDDATLARIDMLEGNGHFYTRKVIDLSETDDIVEAWMYLLPKNFLDERSESCYSRYRVELNERTNWQVWTK